MERLPNYQQLHRVFLALVNMNIAKNTLFLLDLLSQSLEKIKEEILVLRAEQVKKGLIDRLLASTM